MKRILVAVLSFALLTTGCGQVRYVDLTDDQTPVDEVNAALERKMATVLLEDGTRLRVKHIKLARDRSNLTLAYPRTRTSRRAPAGEDMVLQSTRIDQVHVTNHLRGAWQGGLGGFLVGFVVGALVGAVAAVGEDEGSIEVSPGGGALFVGVYLGGIGLGLGTVIGGAVGSRVTYDVWAGPPAASEVRSSH